MCIRFIVIWARCKLAYSKSLSMNWNIFFWLRNSLVFVSILLWMGLSATTLIITELVVTTAWNSTKIANLFIIHFLVVFIFCFVFLFCSKITFNTLTFTAKIRPSFCFKVNFPKKKEEKKMFVKLFELEFRGLNAGLVYLFRGE